MAIYRKVYYDKVSGKVIHQQGYNFQGFIKTTLQQDYQSIKDLNSRSIDTIGLVEFEYDSYDEDFLLCGNNVKVDLNTEELIFTYPSGGGGSVTPDRPLTEQVTELKTENTKLKQQLVQTNDDMQSFIEFVLSTLTV